MITKSSQNKDGHYECKLCDYITCKKCNLDKHITTLKHKKRENRKKYGKREIQKKQPKRQKTRKNQMSVFVQRHKKKKKWKYLPFVS